MKIDFEEIPYFGLRANTTICFCGAAGSGKTSLIAAIIEQRKTTIPDLGPINKLVLCIGAQQELYEDIQSSVRPRAKCETFLNRFPVESLLSSDYWAESGNVLIIDDQMSSILSSKRLTAALTTLVETCAHHQVGIR